jgi:hypothetical protein
VKLIDVIRSRASPESRFGLDDWLGWMQFQGLHYPLGLGQTIQGGREEITSAYESLAGNALAASGPVFAVESIRLHVFSEARFAWQRREQGRPQPMFTDDSPAPRRKPSSSSGTVASDAGTTRPSIHAIGRGVGVGSRARGCSAMCTSLHARVAAPNRAVGGPGPRDAESPPRPRRCTRRTIP